MAIKDYVAAKRDYVIDLRRHFHSNPEPSLEEFRTAEKIEEELDKLGISHKRVGETGVIGFLGKESAEKILVLRADIDALRMQDVKDEPYASKNAGVMHSCGHDSHTAALLGAAAILKEQEAELDGAVRLFFQQAEECGQGARVFIQEGWLEGATRAIGVHVSSGIDVGKIGITAGPLNASVDHFTIQVKGKSAHVSTPHAGIDALYIATQIVNGLQAIVSRRTNPTDTVVVGIGVLHAGDAYNIIARDAVIEGTIRCFSPESREKTQNDIRRIATDIGHAYEGEVTVEYEDFASSLINDASVCEEVRTVAEQIVGADKIVSRGKSLGGDDFAEYLLQVPGCFVNIGTRNEAKPNTTAPHHANNFDIDEEGIVIATNVYVDYAREYLKR